MLHNLNLGKLALMRGDLATAIAEDAADDSIEAALSARDPKDNDQREDMMRVRAILGRMRAMTGDVEVGTRDLQQAVDIAAQLVKLDPSSTSFQEKLSLYFSQLSRLRRLSDDLPVAQTLLAQALPIFAALIKQEPANTDVQLGFAEAQLEQAAQSRAVGQADAARVQARAATALLDPLFAAHPSKRDTLLSMTGAKLLLASVMEDAQTAQQLREEALKMTKGVESGSGDPRLLALQVEALLALGRKTDAQPITQQLWNSGYRDLALVALLQSEHIDYPANAAFQLRLQAATSRNDHP